MQVELPELVEILPVLHAVHLVGYKELFWKEPGGHESQMEDPVDVWNVPYEQL